VSESKAPVVSPLEDLYLIGHFIGRQAILDLGTYRTKPVLAVAIFVLKKGTRANGDIRRTTNSELARSIISIARDSTHPSTATST